MKQREIKFRAWDGSTMFTPCFVWGDIQENGLALRSFYNDFHSDWIFGFPNNIKLMQFTGLHDKNGKEIYEGDIFKYEKHPGYLVDTFISSVKWLEESACYGYQVWPYANQAHEFFSPFSTHDELKEDFLSHLEIIGNIYENLELLTPLP